MELEKLGPFNIGRVLGRGGMGAVYEGSHEETGDPAAVKVLLGSLDDDTEVRLRFESEIETLKRLRHPNIVRLFGFGEEEGKLYYVMEFINGSSLQQELRKKRLFQWHEVAKIGLEICQALRHAHDRGVIHRDIKPANILLDADGKVKLSDFGIARFFGSQQITDIHSVVGTLEFMSPEQALANPISWRTDLYSLGCVLYMLLMSKPPFTARTLPEILRKHQSTAPPAIRSNRYDIPDDLDYIITDLLQIRPEDRPRNAHITAKRLQALLQALIGDPDEIKVLPMSAETPKQPPIEQEPVPFDGSFHPELHIRKPNGFVADGQVIDLGGIVASDDKPTSISPPQQSSLTDSFRRIGEEHQSDRNELPLAEESEESALPTGTVTVSFSADELKVIAEKKIPSREEPAIDLRCGEVLLTRTQTMRHAEDEPLADVGFFTPIPVSEEKIVPPPKDVSPLTPPPKKKLPQKPITYKNTEESKSVLVQDTEEKKLKKQTESQQEPANKQPHSSGHFVTITDEDLDPFEEARSDHRPLLSIPTVFASLALILVGLTVYYLLQPLPPDVLFARINGAVQPGESANGYSLTSLRSAQNHIQQFLMVYPDHALANQVQFYQDELELAEHERRLERRMQFSSLRTLSPVERAYAEVLTSSPNDPERMIDKLRAFIGVFQSSTDNGHRNRHAASPVDVCVELARRRLKKLEQEVDEINAEQEMVIRKRLDEASALESMNPQRAEEIRQGIIELYQDHHWAKELIEEARDKIREKK